MGLNFLKSFLMPRSPQAQKSDTEVHYNAPILHWMGDQDRLQVVNLVIQNPMVYVHNGRQAHREEPAAINTALPIAYQATRSQERELSYWPSYETLTPEQRLLYLQWLAGGRITLPSELGYAFLFFYNLERRALVDELDIHPIMDEVIRLRALYARDDSVSGSWESYTSQFIWYLLLHYPAILEVSALKAFLQTNRRWTEYTLPIALKCLAARQARVTKSTAYEIAASLPGSQSSITQQRVPEEFKNLFYTRFQENYPEGMELRFSKQSRSFVYRPASAVLQPYAEIYSEPFASHYRAIGDIWNSCNQDLRKLGTITRKGFAENSVQHWETLPEELRSSSEHPYTDQFLALVEAATDPIIGGMYSTMQRVATTLSIPIKDESRFSLAQARRMAQMAEEIGYCLEPDARITGVAPKPTDQVGLFLKLSDIPVNGDRYSAAACMLQFGYLVAAADGHADAQELSLVTNQIESAFELHEDEIRRLEVLRVLLIREGVNKSLLRRLATVLTKLQRQAIGRLLTAIVLVDGIVTAEERKSLKAAYSLLELDFAETEANLGVGVSDEPVTVVEAAPGTGSEAIPTAPRPTLKLNREAIVAILRDTQDVAQMLAQAMTQVSSNTEAELVTPQGTIIQPIIPIASPVVPMESLAVKPEMDQKLPPTRYLLLYQQLITRDAWSVKEADTLARTEKLMLAGSLDALNEWAVEALGGPIFYEENEQITVEKSLLLGKV